MKKSLMLAGALVMSMFTFAQNDDDNRSDHHRHRGDRGETMKTVLMLDDKQVQSIKEIDQKYEEKHKGLRKDSTMKRDDRFKAHQELRNQRQAEIGNVLTKEQSTKWAAYKKERKEKRHAERKEKMKTELSLTDDQAKKLDEVNKTTRGEITKLRDSKVEDRQQYRKLRDDHDAQVKSILSPEQYTRWKELRSSKQGRGKKGGQYRK